MRNMTRFRIALISTTALFAFPALADVPAGVQAGTSGGVHGEVQIAKADYAPPQRQIGHQIGSGEPIYMGDQIATGPGGGLQVMLLDQTVMTLGQNAKMTIDEMVYDPSSGAGKLKFNIAQGAFRFVSGQIAKANPENVSIQTPLATIGIRGTLVGGSVDSGNTLVALLGPGDQTNTSARHGAIEVTTPGGTVSISRTGYSTIITPGAPPSPPAPVTPAQLQQLGQAGAGSNGPGGATGGTAGGTAGGTTGGTAGGSSAGSASGQDVARGGAISNVVTTLVSNVQLQSQIVTGNVSSGTQTTTANTNSSTTTTTDDYFSSLTGSSVGYSRSYFYLYSEYSTSYAENFTSDSDTLNYHGHNRWTFNDPNNDETVTLSNWSDSANGTIAGLPSGTKYANVNADSGDHYYGYEFSNVAGLNQTKFGLWLGADSSAFWSANQLSASSSTVGAYSFGIATPTGSMPSSGYATYSGLISGFGTAGGSVYAFTANVNWGANFTNHTISGSTSGALTAANFTGVTASASTPFTQLSFTGGTISANAFSGSTISVSGNTDLNSNSASFSGQFNGGAAKEIGGTFKVVGSNSTGLVGSFGAARGNISASPP